jgi:ubiquinone/menaquinone biosynthesis C-methylase UbiE
MMSEKKQRHEQIYDGTVQYQTDNIPLWGLYKRLRRFEEHVHEVTFRLLPRGERYLDLGCGDGELCHLAASKFVTIYGIDIAEKRLCHAQQQALSAEDGALFCYAVADLDAPLPFPDESFDALTCVKTIQYCYDLRHALREMHRVLRTGGTLILEVSNVAWLPRRLRLLRGQLFVTSLANQYGRDIGILHYFTLDTLIQIVEVHGFRVVERSGAGIFAFLRRRWLTLLSGDLIVKAVKD